MTMDHITEIATKESAAKMIEPGAVLVVVRGMILAHTFPVAVLDAPAAINQDMKALIPNSQIGSDYLCSILWAFNHEILDRVERSSHDTRKLETDKLLSFEIPLPDRDSQRRIVGQLAEFQTKIEDMKTLHAETAAELEALLPAILDRAFRGELIKVASSS